MKKVIGIFVFLLMLYGLILQATDSDYWQSNTYNLGQRVGLAGILCLGAGLLIVTGGVDLSIGSVVGLCAVIFCWLILDVPDIIHRRLPPPLVILGGARIFVPVWLAIVGVLLSGTVIGLVNGAMVTFLRVQPFVVTLCGLFLYRGLARSLRGDTTPPIAERVSEFSIFFRSDFLAVPMYVWLLLILFAVATFFLHATIYGRYFFAIGSNERAARYSGINVDFYKVLAYVLCSLFAAMYAVMYVIHYNTVQPSSTGNFMELYAIAGAVLGGCSLRGGEGTTIGMVIGTSILVLLPNLTNMWGIPDTLEPTIIGGALLVCAVMDEFLRHSGRSH